MYHRSGAGVWKTIGGLTPDAHVETETGAWRGPGQVFEDLKLDYRSTQYVDNTIICTLEREQYSFFPAAVVPKITLPGFPKYESRVQLFKNGVLWKRIDLPNGEVVRRAPQDPNLTGPNYFISFKGGNRLPEATALKLYRVINDDIQGTLTDFVVSQVTVNDGYGDIHTHYDYDTATASIVPSGAGALYGKVTTTYSGASHLVDKRNGFSESVFHSDESAPSTLYRGLLYQTTIFNDQGSPVASNTSHWKAFKKKLTADGIVPSRTGYFVRSVATIAKIDGATKRTEMEYCTGRPQSFALESSGQLPFAVSGCAEIKGAKGWYINDGRLAHSSRGVSSVGSEPWESTIGPLIVDSNLYDGLSLEFQYELSAVGAHGTATFEALINGSQVWSDDRSVMLGEDGFTGSATLNLAFDDGPVEFRVNCRLHGTDMDVNVRIFNISARTTPISTPVEVRNLHYDFSGKPVKTIEASTYAWQKYPSLLEQNVLTPVVETRTRVNGVVTAASAATWGPGNATPCWAPIATYQARRSTQYFDFEQPERNIDWLASSRIVARKTFGVVAETQDVDGIVHSVLYDKEYRLPVATFVHASIERHEAGYCGFEPYEQSAPFNPFNAVLTGNDQTEESENWSDEVWQISGSRERNAHTGIAALSGSPARIEPQRFAPRSKQTSYLVSAWVKLRSGGRGGEIGFGSQPKPITASNDVWQYVELITENPSDNQKPFVSCDGTIDDFRFGPLDAPFNATVYDPEYHLVTARLDSNEGVQRMVYDHVRRPLATLGPDEQIVTVHSERLSREGEQAFNAQQPNQTLTILPRKGGRHYRDFAEYTRRISDPEHADPIGAEANKGVRFGLVPLVQSNPGARSRFTVRFGAASVNGYILKPSVDSGLVLDGLWCEGMQDLNVISTGGLQISSFLLLLTNYHVYCFIDGMLRFRGAFRAIEGFDTARGNGAVPPVPGPLSLEWTPAGNAALVDLLTFYDPLVSLSFSDGLGRVVQTQQLARIIHKFCQEKATGSLKLCY